MQWLKLYVVISAGEEEEGLKNGIEAIVFLKLTYHILMLFLRIILKFILRFIYYFMYMRVFPVYISSMYVDSAHKVHRRM